MISKVLIEDHGKVDELLTMFIDSLKAGRQQTDLFEKARLALHNHIYWEETSLFRSVENDANKARIYGLEVEHGGIWQLLDKVWAYLMNDEVELAIDRIEGLLRVLKSHNDAEEATIYKQLEELGEDTQVKLIHYDLQAARAPEGWKCSILSRR